MSAISGGSANGDEPVVTRRIQPGTCEVSSDPNAVLGTTPLGSCVAVFLHDQQRGIAGGVCFALPDSRLDRTRAKANPFLFGDTGIEALVAGMEEAGALRKRIAITLAGGSATLDGEGCSHSGRRNLKSARRALSRLQMDVKFEKTGGARNLTVAFDGSTGTLTVLRSGTTPRLS